MQALGVAWLQQAPKNTDTWAPWALFGRKSRHGDSLWGAGGTVLARHDLGRLRPALHCLGLGAEFGFGAGCWGGDGAVRRAGPLACREQQSPFAGASPAEDIPDPWWFSARVNVSCPALSASQNPSTPHYFSSFITYPFIHPCDSNSSSFMKN